MFQIDLMSRTPIYEQLREQTQQLVMAGVLKPLDKMPSVRALSAKLSVNPNTIQRAYSEMCTLGIMVSMVGRGYYITENAREIIRTLSLKKFSQLDAILKELLLAGISGDEIEEHVQKVLKEPRNTNE